MYKYALETKNSTPEESVVMTIMFLHFMQLATVTMLVTSVVPGIYNIINPGNKIGVILFLFFFYFLIRRLIYNKSKWVAYIKEFENESQLEKRKGFWIVFVFIVGTIFLFFLPILVRLY
jgi:Ca2+/Na+ antiporter